MPCKLKLVSLVLGTKFQGDGFLTLLLWSALNFVSRDVKRPAVFDVKLDLMEDVPDNLVRLETGK